VPFIAPSAPSCGEPHIRSGLSYQQPAYAVAPAAGPCWLEAAPRRTDFSVAGNDGSRKIPRVVLKIVVAFVALGSGAEIFAGAAGAAAAPSAVTPSAYSARVPVSVATLRDVGDETAVAAVESLVLAAASGKATAVSEMIRWTWRENAHRSFADMPPSWTEKTGSPEKLIGVGEVLAFARVARVQVIAHVIVSAAEEIFGLRADFEDGRSTEHLFWMRWAGSRWLRVEPSTMVVRLARQIAAGGTPNTTDPATFREQYDWIVPQTGKKPALPEAGIPEGQKP
jgi:hypothetical protein